MTTVFHSHGKLLLTGEYVVLDGARALALPSKYGQSLKVVENKSKQLSWTGYNRNKTPWFETVIDIEKDKLHSNSSDSEDAVCKTLLRILNGARNLNPKFLDGSKGYEVVTELDFPLNWGLGSSSTLINNIAQWAAVNAFELQRDTFPGSGYDIACAQHHKPVVYQLEENIPKIVEVDFSPHFKNSLYFVHLNKKQSSREAIAFYRSHVGKNDHLITQISKITMDLLGCSKISDFEALLLRHESLLSKALGIPRVKDLYFSDFPGAVKSLGAWGGDFILAIGGLDTPAYFHDKGYHTVLSYDSLVL